MGRSELRHLTGRNDGQPGTELNFKFYRQATNTLASIGDEAAAFLDSFFWRPRLRRPEVQFGSAASATGSPAMRLCHMMRRWVMSHGVAWCIRQRLSHSTASPGTQSWW